MALAFFSWGPDLSPTLFPLQEERGSPWERPTQHTVPPSLSALTLGPMVGLGILTMR